MQWQTWGRGGAVDGAHSFLTSQGRSLMPARGKAVAGGSRAPTS